MPIPAYPPIPNYQFSFIMKYYCPDCDEYSAFKYWNASKKEYWLACTICWRKDESDAFGKPKSSSSGNYWDHIDDWIKEYKINRKI
jgi:hypothetical protein